PSENRDNFQFANSGPPVLLEPRVQLGAYADHRRLHTLKPPNPRDRRRRPPDRKTGTPLLFSIPACERLPPLVGSPEKNHQQIQPEAATLHPRLRWRAVALPPRPFQH